MYCKNCGTNLENSSICPNCGAMNTVEIKQGEDRGETNIGLVILSVLFPLFGFIYGAVIWNNSRREAKAYITAAAITVGAYLALYLFSFLFAFMLIF